MLQNSSGFSKTIFFIIFVVWNPFWACHFFSVVAVEFRDPPHFSLAIMFNAHSAHLLSPECRCPQPWLCDDISVRNGDQCFLRHPGTWVQTLYEYFLLFTYHQTDLYFCVKYPNVWNSQWQKSSFGFSSLWLSAMLSLSSHLKQFTWFLKLEDAHKSLALTQSV